jgi:hypothetical protein
MSSFKVASHLKSVINTTTPIVLENEKASSPFHIRVSQDTSGQKYIKSVAVEYEYFT